MDEPFGTIVVGVDGADGGRDALALARMLASPTTRVVAAHAFPCDPTPSTGVIAKAEKALEAASRQLLAEEAPDADERVSIADTSPARALHHLATAYGASAIAVGSSHRGAIGRALLGDTARGVLHGAPCPVLVAPRGYAQRDREIHLIGVGYDGTAESRMAVGTAIAIAKARGAALHIRTAVVPPSVALPTYADMIDYAELAETQLEAAREQIDEVVGTLDVPSAGDVVSEPAGEALARLSEEVDLLIVGSRGWSSAARVVLGSTADRLANESSCPLLVVPAPVEQPAAQRAGG